jgi:hypothetical protein
MRPIARPSVLGLAFTLIALVLALLGPASASAVVSCDRYASPVGSDSAAGTLEKPYRTVSKLLSSLTPGQDGCLRSGTYSDKVTFVTPGVTLASAPGERAILTGRVYVDPGATDVTMSALTIDGSKITEAVVVHVRGSRFHLLDSEVTARDTGHICVLLDGGSRGVVASGNQVHNCGLPGQNYHVHGFYLQDTAGAQIVNNYIYDNKSGWGIHFWTNGDDVLVANNVLDGNRGGITVGGNSTAVSERNTIRNNIITNNGTIDGVTSYWGSTPGTGNVVRDNCFWQNQAHNLSGIGYVASGSKVADPLYVDRSAKNFRLQPGSPCAGMGPSGGSTSGGSASGGSASGGGTTTLSVKTASPQDGQAVTGAVSWTATSSQSLDRVEFYRDGVLVSTDKSAPYGVSWDTTTASNGPHQLKVRGVTGTGQAAEDAATVTVANALSVGITSPQSAATVSGTVRWSASPSTSASRVEFYANGTLVATDTSAPYEVNWDTTAFSNSYHTLRVVAHRTTGGPAEHSIYVKVDNATLTSLRVAITSFADGQKVSRTVLWTATATASIAEMRFYRDGLLAAIDRSAPYEVSWNTKKSSVGSHTLKVVGRAADGRTVDDTVSVVVVRR